MRTTRIAVPVSIVKAMLRMLSSHYPNRRGGAVPKREKSKRLQVVISEAQDSLLTKTAYQLSNPERLVSKSEVVRLGIEMLNQAVEEGKLDPRLLKDLDES
jgi:hypothetical protein